ncbi:dihydroxyacetone kinase (plasmid) [Paraburkholderia terrae]|uniref:Dihydroxyacetone kinase n=1 Tax=Paraburkholderia terrae TaxID=311230 RepID=A0ABM7UBE9_9BURK|nr:type 1 glutamine amidotransferase domain-containing protein [Paraburkholderia terrae]BCZ85603.1 dihydroxyacetone kinase [Paraburkholderia terrae]BDC45941.1 dihydroxyacetone kinase [Paraburkholderia terrae]
MNQQTANPRIRPALIVLTSHGTKGDTNESTGFYLSELTHPLAVFDAAGIPVAISSIQGGEPPIDGLDLSDATNERYWNDDRFRAAIRNTRPLANVDPSRYSAIFFVGGHGAMWDFPMSADLQRITRDAFESGTTVVAAVCHGPAALVNVTLTDGTYLVANRKVSAFTDEEERAVQLDEVVPFLLGSTLVARGALYQPAPAWTRNIVADGHLVTGQNPQSATGVAQAVRDLVLANAARV